MPLSEILQRNKVPLSVLHESFYYVINATHPDFKKIKQLKITDLIPVERVEEL
jgi:hypothetical protein